MNYLYSVLIGYGLGCIQAAYLFSRFILKEDIRNKGNGNAGASNMTVAYGKKFGLAVAVIDIIKATAAVLIVKNMFAGAINLNTLTYTAGLFVILGHNYPFYMGFKGGKGTASLIGMLFGLNPMMGGIGLIILIAATFISDYIVIGTFSLLLSFIVMTHFMNLGLVPLAISILIGLLSVYKHRENIVKIINREEKSVRGTLLKKKTGE
jgi:glycerol-3-phosphate acyltransferase PlsY